jgi:hypothetical protein
MLRITPKHGLVIRDPENQGRILPASGIQVSRLSPFWYRRFTDGDVDVTTVIDAPQVPTLPRMIARQDGE